MIKNLGNTDRQARVILAVIIILLYLADMISGVSAIILLSLAIILIITASIGVCPLYLPFGISTRRKTT